MERPIAVPRPANPLVKQGPDSPVSVFDFERKKRRSKSKGKSEFRGLYPPPRPPKRTDSTSPPLRRCLSEPVTPPSPSPEKVASRPDQVSGNVLSELNSGNGNPRALCFVSDSDSADPAEAPASCGSRAVSSPLAGKENRGKVASAGTAWKDGMRTTGCSEIEEVDCGAADKKRACAVLQGMTPFAFWTPVPGGNGAVEHRKILYAAPIRAEVEEVIININFHKVSKRDLQLNRRESRRLVLLFILFNLLFGGSSFFGFLEPVNVAFSLLGSHEPSSC